MLGKHQYSGSQAINPMYSWNKKKRNHINIIKKKNTTSNGIKSSILRQQVKTITAEDIYYICHKNTRNESLQILTYKVTQKRFSYQQYKGPSMKTFLQKIIYLLCNRSKLCCLPSIKTIVLCRYLSLIHI